MGLRGFFFRDAFDAGVDGAAGSPLQVDQDNNLVVAGEGYASLDGNTHAGSADVFLMKFTSNGTWLWTVQRGGSRAVLMQVWSELLHYGT